MTDPFIAAEQAAQTAYGTCRTAGEAERLADALAAYRHTLTAAGLIHTPVVEITPEHAETAARFLGEHADRAGFPRYTGDGWRRLLTSRIDVDLAHRKATTVLAAADADAARDLMYARRILNSYIDTPREET